MFSRAPIAFDYLKKFDLALTLDVESFDTSDSEAQSAEFALKLASGHLQVEPGVIRYPKGEVDVTLSVDARDEPHLRYTASGNNLNPWLGISGGQRGAREKLNADVDVDIDLTAYGRSPHALASSLDGSVYITIKDGNMRRSFVDLLFVDIVGWTASLVR